MMYKITHEKINKFSENDIRAFFRFLEHPKGTYTEIRAIQPHTRRSKQYFVTNEREFVDRCRELDGKYNVYAGVNPRKEKRGDASSIHQVTVIPVDIDAKHPKNEAATEEENKRAAEEAIKVKKWMEEEAQTKVAATFSGNGFHLLIPVYQEVKEGWGKKIAEFYQLLQQKFENKSCSIDNIGDLPRIIKVPGTKSIKGSNSEERPYRYSYAIELEREESKAIIDFIEKLAIKKFKTTEFELGIPKGIRPCFKEAEKRKLVIKDRFRFAVACEYIANGYGDEYIHRALAHYPDYDRDITQYQIDRLRNAGGKPLKCKTIASKYPELRETCQYCEKRGAEPQSVSYFLDGSKIYLEVLTTQRQYKFAHLEKEGIKLVDRIEDSKECTLVPRELPEKERRLLDIVKMPNEGVAKVPLLDAQTLFKKVEVHFRKYIELNQLELSLCIYYTFFTWFYLKANVTGYLRFLADTGKGKTRMLKVVSDLCFYPVMVTGAGSFSGAMRTNEKWRGTMVIDESDFIGEKEHQILKYLNLGFQKGMYFPLSDKEDPKKQEWFDPFSPKILAMREPFNDNATEGRLLSISPRETTNPDIPILLGEEYNKEAAHLRNLIARFVLEHWDRMKGEEMIDFKDMQLEARLKQLAMPLSILFQVWPDGLPAFREYLIKRQKEIKKDRARSWHGSLFNFVYAVASGEERITEEELQAVIPSMVARNFHTTAKNATRSLGAIGFEIERKYITHYIAKEDKVEERRKQVRAYVVPDEQTWREMVQRYYYSEDDRTDIDIPDILMSSQYTQHRNQTTLSSGDTYDTYDTYTHTPTIFFCEKKKN